MKQIKSISAHRPGDMIIDVSDEDAKEILLTGEFVEIGKEKLIIQEKKTPIVEDEAPIINRNRKL